MVSNINDIHNIEFLSNLVRRLKFTPVRAGFYVVIFNIISGVMLSLYFNAWYPKGISRGFSTDLPTLAYEALIQPVIIGYFVWLQNSIPQLFKNLVQRDGKTIFTDVEGVEIEIFAYVRYLQHPKLPIFFGILSILMGVITYFSFTKTLIPNSAPAWLTVHPMLALSRSFTYPLIFYCVLFVVYDLFILVSMMSRLFKKYNIQVSPYHSDNAGGLGSIGHFFANLGYAMAAIGVTLAISIIYDLPRFFSGKDYALIIYVGLYVLFSPLVFFIPLLSAHSAMVRHKDLQLAEISVEYDKALLQFHKLSSKTPPKTDAFSKYLNQLDGLYSRIKGFPVWPFNVMSIRKFFSLVISPVIATAISFVFDLIKP